MSRILTLDAGFTSTGWAVLEGGGIVAAGCIRTERSAKKRGIRVADDDADRCATIARGLAGIVQNYAIRGIVCEAPSGGAKGARAIACMARAGAIVATVAELLALPCEWVTPQAVKRTAGTGAVSKADVEAVILRRWQDAPLPRLKCEREHVTDALGAYLAAEHGQLVRMLNGPVQAAGLLDGQTLLGARTERGGE
ncbi:MAG: hypothetical protein HS116_05230 [Planctomycetes bacterium]|nr:hypothetical protein [Planctomycetota bacterium]